MNVTPQSPSSSGQGPLLLPPAQEGRAQAQERARLHRGRQLVRHLHGHRQEGRGRDPRLDRQHRPQEVGSQESKQDPQVVRLVQGRRRASVRYQASSACQGRKEAGK